MTAQERKQVEITLEKAEKEMKELMAKAMETEDSEIENQFMKKFDAVKRLREILK